MKYMTASDFRRTLIDHLGNRARREGVSVNRLQKQVAFERFLARLFHGGKERWVLKGGYALELRLSGIARATRDLDLNVPPPLTQDLIEELQEAASLNLGDYFEFIVAVPAKRAELVGPPLGGYRLGVETYLAGRLFDRFPLDVGQGDQVVREPDVVRGQVDLTFAGLSIPSFPVYPLEDHFAEKLHAFTTPREIPTRVKDLVDMLLLMDLGLRPSELLLRSLQGTFERYGRHALPAKLPEPPSAWRDVFAQLCNEVGMRDADLTKTYSRLQAFVDEVVI